MRGPTPARSPTRSAWTARTIRRDIDYMRDQLHAPIEFDSVQNGYYYTEPTFRLPFPQLTQGRCSRFTSLNG